MKKHVSEIFEKEESQCDEKMREVQRAIEFTRSLQAGDLQNCSDPDIISDVELLECIQPLLQDAQTSTKKLQIKDLSNLYASASGLQTPLRAGTPILSMKEIKIDQEQTQISKIILPAFKG